MRNDPEAIGPLALGNAMLIPRLTQFKEISLLHAKPLPFVSRLISTLDESSLADPW